MDHRLFGERVGQRLAADDENRDGREPGGVFRLLGHGRHLGGRLARRRLSPGERGQVVEHLGEERELLLAEAAGLGAAVEHGQHLLERSRHRLEPQEARGRPERVQAAPQLVAGRLRRGIVLERVEQLAPVAHLAPERRHEIGPRPSEAPTRGVPGLGRATRHDPTRP